MSLPKQANKALFICLSIIVLIGFVFFFPKEYTSCGALSDGSSCNTYRCAGIYGEEYGMTDIRHECIGFDLGSTNYFRPYTNAR